MASIDDELLQDEQETRREMAYIREELPDDVAQHYADDELLAFVLDAIASYYVESGVLESQDDEVDIDMDAVAAYVCASVKQELGQKLDPQEVSLIAEADLDFLAEE